MSRYLKKAAIHGKWVQVIEDMNKCSWLVDDVCCNGDCEHCGDFPDDEDCEVCNHFKSEDGMSIRRTICQL